MVVFSNFGLLHGSFPFTNLLTTDFKKLIIAPKRIAIMIRNDSTFPEYKMEYYTEYTSNHFISQGGGVSDTPP